MVALQDRDSSADTDHRGLLCWDTDSSSWYRPGDAHLSLYDSAGLPTHCWSNTHCHWADADPAKRVYTDFPTELADNQNQNQCNRYPHKYTNRGQFLTSLQHPLSYQQAAQTQTIPALVQSKKHQSCITLLIIMKISISIYELL